VGSQDDRAFPCCRLRNRGRVPVRLDVLQVKSELMARKLGEEIGRGVFERRRAELESLYE